MTRKKSTEVDYKDQYLQVEKVNKELNDKLSAQGRTTQLQAETIRTLNEKIVILESQNLQYKSTADEATAKSTEALNTQRYLEGVIKGKDDMIAGLQDILKTFTIASRS